MMKYRVSLTAHERESQAALMAPSGSDEPLEGTPLLSRASAWK